MSLARRAVFYPETDNMCESVLQSRICELLRPLLERWLAEKGRPMFVGGNNFIYFVEGDPTHRIGPDVYVLPHVDPASAPRSWKLWEIPSPPSFCLEVVSTDVGKDYSQSPAVLGSIGVKELVVFDPEARGRRDRWLWQVFRRGPKGFFLEEHTNADRVRTRELDAWLRVVGSGDAQRVRLAVGPSGDALVATADERAEAERERAEAERERAQAERERAEAERERADRAESARVALEKRVAQLERGKRRRKPRK